MTSCQAATRVIYIVLNTLHFCVGFLMIAIGIWFEVDPTPYIMISVATNYDCCGSKEYFTPLATTDILIFIPLGCFMVAVGIVGFLGSYCCKKSRRCLDAFKVLLGITMVAELFTVSLDIISVFKVEHNLHENMMHEISQGMQQDHFFSEWNHMQVQFECCGTYNYTDWLQNTYLMTTNHTVPWSCCKTTSGRVHIDDVINLRGCAQEAEIPPPGGYQFLNTDGCADELEHWLESAAGVAITLVAIVFAIQMLWLICMCVAGCSEEDEVDNSSRPPSSKGAVTPQPGKSTSPGDVAPSPTQGSPYRSDNMAY